jgi:Fe-S cluster assembly scaffold protein SufB
MSELDELMVVMGEAGGSAGVLADPGTAHLTVSGRSILSSRAVEGLDVDARETRKGVSARVVVREGVKLRNPVHLCFGVLHRNGSQEIVMDVKLEKNASAAFIAHCVFPRAEKIIHTMQAKVDIAEGAEMRYSEAHYHGMTGGIEVLPKLSVNVGKNGRYFTDFSLLKGRVGRLEIDYEVSAGENAVVELTARIFGHANDDVKIKEKISLSGENARGLIKARVAVEDDARAEITGITEGNAAGSRGHMDCMEIVKDRAIARAVPLVQVTNPLAKVTHEAAIGSVDKRQMETLMAHGLSPDQAVDVIVKGILR